MKKFFSPKILISVLAGLVIVAVYLRSQINTDLHTYPFDDKIALKRIDYFSHYQLISTEDELLLDNITKIGMQDSMILFFSQTGEVLAYNKNKQVLNNLPANELTRPSEIESYNPWNLTDSMNDEDNMRLALKLCYFAMIIILASLITRWIRKKI